MKIFISGPMSGYKDNNAGSFFAMEHAIKLLDHDVYNPAWNDYGVQWRRADYLAMDIMALSRCDMMVQLDGWEGSRGCLVEKVFAETAGITIVDQNYILGLVRKREENRDPYTITRD